VTALAGVARPAVVRQAAPRRLDAGRETLWCFAGAAVSVGGAARVRTPARDAGAGGRWILGTTFAYLEADAPRVYCKDHRVVVAQVPWARHDSRFTIAFEDQCCWLAVNTSKKAVSQLMRVTWRTVGSICERVAEEATAQRDLLTGLKRIGIDDFSHRKGHRYLTVVVDHDSGRLVWAAAGRDRKTVEKFLDLLGTERCGQLELVSCDMAEAIALAVSDQCPNAIRCVDPFHVIKLATDALDEVRREVWNQARRAGHKQAAKELKGARFALWKNPGRLTERQHHKLAQIQQTNKPLYRAYLISQQLREIYPSPTSKQSSCSTRGSPGQDDVACSHSSSSPRRCPTSVTASKRPFATDSATHGSNRSTPSCA